MTDQLPDKPFAIWRVFHDAPRWWFARGCPPPLRDERVWVRALRMGVLLGTAGAAAGILAISMQLALAFILTFGATTEALAVIYALAGCVFGAMVLVPASRWLGCPWWHSLLSIPVAAAIFELPWSFDNGQVDYSGISESSAVVWMAIHAVMGQLLAVWMGAVSRRPCIAAMIFSPLLALLALSVMAAAYWMFMEYAQLSGLHYEIPLSCSVFACYFASLALAAGIPLIWCPDFRPVAISPEPTN